MKAAAADHALLFEDVNSPVGRLRLIGTAEALVAIWFEHGRDAARSSTALMNRSSAVLVHARYQLEEYFAGTRRSFDLPLAPRGTPFQRRVWECLRHIEYGATKTYGALALELGNSKASRAVGLANGSNPIPIVIPCHRVIGADGSLTGFGGGLPVKSALLSLERAGRQPLLI